jgi:hypothetical protein
VLIASGRAVYRIARDGSAQLLVQAREIVSVAIFRNGADAAVWDGGTGSLHLLQNVSSATVERVLASGLKGLGKLYPSWDGGTIFVAKRGTKALFWLDVASGEVQSVDSAAEPMTLDPLHNRDTFLISARPHQPGWISYFDGSMVHVVFVPAPNGAMESVP